MKKAFIPFVFAVFFISPTVMAQIEDPDDLIHGNLIASKSKTETEGTPYFTIKWLKGKIIVKNSKKTRELPVRYNMANNTVEYKRKGKRFIVKASKIEGFIILTDKKNIVFKNGYSLENDGVNSSTLMRVVYGGSIKLLAHHEAELKEDLANYGSATKKNAYHKDIDYYLVVGNGSAIEIKLEKDDILDALEGKNATLIDFASKNNLDFADEKDVRRIIRYYDTSINN